MSRTLLSLLAASAVFVPAILIADGEGLARQLTLGLLTAAMVWLVARRAAIDTKQILVAIAVATTGEVILSVGLELYDYRFATIPFYVPPGHGLFYALAAATARERWLQARGKAIVRGVLLVGSATAIAGLTAAGDAWGALWWIVAAVLIGRSRNGLLLSVCCSYTMILEWLGTSMGNWVWAPEVLGLRSGNPPSGVGILYVVLDLVTVAICGTLAGKSSTPAPTADPCVVDGGAPSLASEPLA
ncbi:MAG: hypothetical protein HYU52_04210 [Acidobacteria bacterium]|nr:hypothetical protein [Acidobacteriota bacterium]